MSRIADAWRALVRAAPRQPSGFATRLQPLSAPPRRASWEAPRAYIDHPWLRAVASKIASSVASHVPVLYRERADGERVVVTKHPALSLVRRPNRELTGREARKLTQLHYELAGESFWLLWANSAGEPVSYYPIPPSWVLEVPNRGRDTFRISHDGIHEDVPRDAMLWVRDLNPLDPYGRGTGIAEALGDELDTDEYAARYIKTFFFNRAVPEMIISAEGIGEEQARAAKEYWEQEHRGWWNGFRSWWTPSKITVSRLDTSFRDSQLVELRAAQRDIVISVFGVSPEILGIVENSNRATIDGAKFIYASEVIAPRLAVIEDNLNERLLPRYRDYETSEGRLVFAYERVVPEDREHRRSLMSMRPSAFTDNEVRLEAGFAEATGKDEYPAAMPSFGVPGAMGADPEWTRYLPGKVRAPATDVDIGRVLEALRPERLTVEIDPVMQAGVEEWSKKILRELGQEAKFDILNPLIPRFLTELSTKDIKGLVDGSTRDALRVTLTEGVRAGESIDDLALRVEEVFDAADEARAERIARTEVLKASNWATREAQKASGVVDRRRWVSTKDARTRDSHRDMDGVEVGIDELFRLKSGDNAGAEAIAPGSFGIAAEDVNCRCTTVAVISDDLDDVELAAVPETATTDDLVPVWRAYDSRLRPWERDTIRALRRGFRAQREDVLKALRAQG